MKKDYTKLYDDWIGHNGTQSKGKSGKWHNARPERFHSVWCDIRNAWNVLIGRADALYWTIDDDK